MFTSSDLPRFKKGDLVKSLVTLPVVRTETSRMGPILENPVTRQRFALGELAIDDMPVQGQLIQSGVVFQVDAILPGNTSEAGFHARYQLTLNPSYLTGLEQTDRELTEAQLMSLNHTLGFKGKLFPFYVVANEDNLVIETTTDGRELGNRMVEVWTADDNFPWSVLLQFPTAEQVLHYDIQAWVYEDADSNSGKNASWFSLWLSPLHVSASECNALLSLEVKSGEWLDFEQPTIDFQAERKAKCIVNTENQSIEIIIHFSIHIDLERQQWRFVDLG